MNKAELINLNQIYPDKKIVIVDSCGWFYKQNFPDSDIVKFEGLYVAKNVSMAKEKFDYLFDDKDHDNLRFPLRPCPRSVLIIDHSPLMKYRSGQQMQTVLTDLAQAITPDTIHVRMPLWTTGDFRLTDRLQELVQIVPAGYVTLEFNYSVNKTDCYLEAKFMRRKEYASVLY